MLLTLRREHRQTGRRLRRSRKPASGFITVRAAAAGL
jgi:hypothetical protein